MFCFLCFYDPTSFITVAYTNMNGALYITVATPMRIASVFQKQNKQKGTCDPYMNTSH